MRETVRNKVLVAPLNWGLGHVSRCIPIVKFLIANNLEPVIASDGDALVFFRKEFPTLDYIELPSYGIVYAKKAYALKFKLLFSFFFIRKAVAKERKFIEANINPSEFVGIISDNRFGVCHSKIPSVYITHQLSVLSGLTTKITSFVHQRIIAQFDECWVPDTSGKMNLGGRLSQSSKDVKISVKYIGPLSRLNKLEVPIAYDLLVLLSGPEPQRTLLENKLLSELERFEGKIAFVRGVVSSGNKINAPKNMKVYNFLLSENLEKLMHQSELVICRSGYSSIMDLQKLEKKAFFIPTPGQTEQVYLAKRMQELQIADYCCQKEFTLACLARVNSFLGFSNRTCSILEKDLLQLFT
ncbi:glycosyltransferase [Flavicella sediminum]|uniref:glycosyltransferase n=1 Tax=Flavicella sediminum TaxID=2585141 RepID=UPI00112215D2|nr:glycosyltransferase [Flavicella sediminum]